VAIHCSFCRCCSVARLKKMTPLNRSTWKRFERRRGGGGGGQEKGRSVGKPKRGTEGGLLCRHHTAETNSPARTS
jgi:hypothetical protein